jgi:hypothetical protein
MQHAGAGGLIDQPAKASAPRPMAMAAASGVWRLNGHLRLHAARAIRWPLRLSRSTLPCQRHHAAGPGGGCRRVSSSHGGPGAITLRAAGFVNTATKGARGLSSGGHDFGVGVESPKPWAELNERQRKVVSALGWDADAWDANVPHPKWHSEMSGAERRSAGSIGLDQMVWPICWRVGGWNPW